MKHASAALFLLLLLSLASAEKLDILKAGKLEAEVLVNWTITVEGDENSLSELTLSGNLLSNSSGQRVSYFWTNYPYEMREEEGDIKLIYRIEKPGKKILVQTRSIVEVDYDGEGSGVLEAPPYPFQSDVGYLDESPLTGSNEEMRQTAEGLAEGQSDSLELLAKLTEWTHNYVNYSLGYADTGAGAKVLGFGETSYPAEDVFRLRQGACDEYSHLMIAMMRSLGMPARVALGYVNSGKEWGPHAWVEAYVPGYGWLPIDPTFNELGKLDATHIKMASAADQSSIVERVEAKGTEDVSLSVEKSFYINVVGTENFAPIADGSLNASQVNDSLEEVRLELTNRRDEHVFIPLRLNVPQELTVRGGERMVHLAPGEKRLVKFNVDVPQLDKYTVYSFPMVVSTLGTEYSGEFRRSPLRQQIEDGEKNNGNQSGLITTCPATAAAFALLAAFAFAARRAS